MLLLVQILSRVLIISQSCKGALLAFLSQISRISRINLCLRAFFSQILADFADKFSCKAAEFYLAEQ